MRRFVTLLAVLVLGLVGGTASEISAASEDDVDRFALPGPGTADALTVGAYAIWIVDRSADRVIRFDPHTEEVIGTIAIPDPFDVAWREGSVWVTSATGVVQIDEKSGTVLGTVPTAELGISSPGAVAVGGGSVWVVGTDEDVVVIIDQDDRSVEATVPVGTAPTDLAYALGVWVANSGDRTISKIASATDDARTITSKKLDPGPVSADATTGTWTRGSTRPGSLCRLGKKRSFDVCTKLAAKPVALASGFALVWVAADDGNAYAVSAIRPGTNRVYRTDADALVDIATDGSVGWAVDSVPGASSLLRLGG